MGKLSQRRRRDKIGMSEYCDSLRRFIDVLLIVNTSRYRRRNMNASTASASLPNGARSRSVKCQRLWMKTPLAWLSARNPSMP